MEGGGGLSTICGFGLVKREKKLAHIYSDSCLYLLISFYLTNLTEREVSQEKNASAFFDMTHPKSIDDLQSGKFQGKEGLKKVFMRMKKLLPLFILHLPDHACLDTKVLRDADGMALIDSIAVE